MAKRMKESRFRKREKRRMKMTLLWSKILDLAVLAVLAAPAVTTRYENEVSLSAYDWPLFHANGRDFVLRVFVSFRYQCSLHFFKIIFSYQKSQYPNSFGTLSLSFLYRIGRNSAQNKVMVIVTICHFCVRVSFSNWDLINSPDVKYRACVLVSRHRYFSLTNNDEKKKKLRNELF